MAALFWTNNPNNIDYRIKNLPSLQLKLIDEFSTHKLYPDFTRLMKTADVDMNPVPFLTQGSDVLRLLAVQKYGGVYHDCDFEIFDGKRLSHLCQNYSLILTQESPTERDSANFFIAAKPHHDVVNHAIDLIYRNFNEVAPAYVTHAVDKTNKLVYETGPCVLTAAFLAHIEHVTQGKAANDFIYFLSGGLSHYTLARSTEPKPSSPSCQNTPDDKIERDILFEGLRIPTIGADLLCGGWSEAHGFSTAITYFSASYANQTLQCGSWVDMPYTLTPSPYSLSMGEGYDQCYRCGVETK